MNFTRICEALRKCPVTRGRRSLIFEPSHAYNWVWMDDEYLIRACDQGEGEDVMIAAWIKYLRDRGHGPMIMKDRIQIIDAGDIHDIMGDDLLEVLAEAVVQT